MDYQRPSFSQAKEDRIPVRKRKKRTDKGNEFCMSFKI